MKIMIMMMMHVYRKFVIFNIYIYTWFEGYYIYFLKCYWGFFATESTLLGHGAIKKSGPHTCNIHLSPLYITCDYIDIYLFSLWHIFYRLYDKSILLFCIKTFHTWLPLFSPFLIHRHISVLYIELFRIMFSCSVLSLAHEKMMQYEEVTDKRC